VALIIAGIGLASGILDNQLFAVIILMTLVTTLAAPPLLNAALRIPGRGTRRLVKDVDSASAVWEFESGEIADLVVDLLLKDLRREGFYVQMMNIDEGISQARKDDIALSITEEESTVTIETAKSDMLFVKTAVYEVILRLSDRIARLIASSDPGEMKKGLVTGGGRSSDGMLSLIEAESVCMDLKGETKAEIITELVDMLAARGRLLDRDMALADVLEREKAMSTGMQYGIALPHGKTEGVRELAVGVGIKRQGVDFDSLDGEKSRLFIIVVSPRRISGPHVQFLAAVGAVLQDEKIREAVISAGSREEVADLLRKKRTGAPEPGRP
jgi:mannitol/fructose-specific phosphotransferase system IIA component (Ntr-type)